MMDSLSKPGKIVLKDELVWYICYLFVDEFITIYFSE